MLKNREEWLNEVAKRLAPAFAERNAPLPQKIRLSVGFPSTGSKGKRIGEAWASEASADHSHEILIRPDIDDPEQVAAILTHELTHCAVGLDKGHGRAFKRVAEAMGLQGKMTATTGGPEFSALFAPILSELGPLPHAALNLAGDTSRPKKQTSRMIKCTCLADGCGYVVRTARAWIEQKGPPHCPEHGAMTPELPDDEELTDADRVPEQMDIEDF